MGEFEENINTDALEAHSRVASGETLVVVGPIVGRVATAEGMEPDSEPLGFFDPMPPAPASL